MIDPEFARLMRSRAELREENELLRTRLDHAERLLRKVLPVAQGKRSSQTLWHGVRDEIELFLGDKP